MCVWWGEGGQTQWPACQVSKLCQSSPSHICLGRSRSETELREEQHERFLVLADYDPLSDRELALRQTDLVELLKTGCAGWWFVRLVRAPYTQGWAPSTYLQTLEEM